MHVHSARVLERKKGHGAVLEKSCNPKIAACLRSCFIRGRIIMNARVCVCIYMHVSANAWSGYVATCGCNLNERGKPEGREEEVEAYIDRRPVRVIKVSLSESASLDLIKFSAERNLEWPSPSKWHASCARASESRLRPLRKRLSILNPGSGQLVCFISKSIIR